MSRDREIVDYVLGTGDETERRAMRDEIENDLEFATEVAELRGLFEDMRSLTAEPTGRVPLAVRYAVTRRQTLRCTPVRSRRDSVRFGLRVAAAAAIWLAVSLVAFGPGGTGVEPLAGIDGLPPGPTFAAPRTVAEIDPEIQRLLDAEHVPIASPGFVAAVERFGNRPVPDGFGGWLSAENRIARLRAEYRLRFSVHARRLTRTATGIPDVEDRTKRLSATVAERVRDAFAQAEVPGDLDVRDIATAMRALLASGSTTTVGEYQHVVQASLRVLTHRLPQLDGEELATALAALTDLAVVHGGPVVELIETHADRLARETLRSSWRSRPALLNWQTPVAALADAGRVFQLAPAFGVHAGLAFKARLLIAAHVDERLAQHREEERPGLVVAHLYGFGDLIDRDEADRMLKLWHPRFLVHDYIALHHLAWSKYPVRSGWAEFQSELRGLAGLATPDGISDAAALLLCLSVNSAAPGVLEECVPHPGP